MNYGIRYIEEEEDNVSEANDDSWKACLFHKTSPVFRYFTAVCICFLCFGYYFCSFTTSVLTNNMLEDLDLSPETSVYLIAFQRWPSVIFCPLIGFLVDRIFGITKSAFILEGLVFLGQLIFSFGVLINSIWLIYGGLFILW